MTKKAKYKRWVQIRKGFRIRDFCLIKLVAELDHWTPWEFWYFLQKNVHSTYTQNGSLGKFTELLLPMEFRMRNTAMGVWEVINKVQREATKRKRSEPHFWNTLWQQQAEQTNGGPPTKRILNRSSGEMMETWWESDNRVEGEYR